MDRNLATLGLILSLGCGGDGGTGGENGSGLGAGVTCQDACAFEQECGTEDELADCLAYCDCIAPLSRPDFDAAFWSCITQSCDESEDACMTEVAADMGGTPASEAFEAACMARSADCGAALSDDYCFSAPLSDAAIAELEPCLELGCEAAADCIAGVVGACK